MKAAGIGGEREGDFMDNFNEVPTSKAPRVDQNRSSRLLRLRME